MTRAKICIVGEAFGESEAKYSFPFVGKSGFALFQMLFESGFPFSSLPDYFPGGLKLKMLWQNSPIVLTNVFIQRPKDNNLEEFLAKKNEDVCKDLPPVRPGLYLREEFRPELDRLHGELRELKPNLILALGNTACWAILQTTKISDLRGTVVSSPFGKVLPTYHPSAVLRNWELRPIVIADLFKARREMESPAFSRKRREIWVEPDIPDLWNWWKTYGSKSSLLSIDIETEHRKQISEIGIASDSTHAIHIPFIVTEEHCPECTSFSIKRFTKKGGSWNKWNHCDKCGHEWQHKDTGRTKSYWPDSRTEALAWSFVRHVMTSLIPKLGQNFLYDIQYLWKVMGIPTKNFAEDTMLLHHALYPGMPKSLGFLGSIYTNEPAWKHLRKEGNKDDE